MRKQQCGLVIGMVLLGTVWGPWMVYGQQDSIEPVPGNQGTNFSGESFIPTVEQSSPIRDAIENTAKVLREGAAPAQPSPITPTPSVMVPAPAPRPTTPAPQPQVDTQWETEQAELRARLLEQQRELDGLVDNYTGLTQDIEDYTAQLTPLRMQIQTLSGQISLLEDEILINEKKISSVELQIQRMRVEIDVLLDEIDELEDRLRLQRDAVVQYMRLLYEHENKFYNFQTGKLDDMKLLLSSEKMAEVFRSQRYLTLVEQSIRTLIDRYEQTRLDYEWNKELLFTKQDRLRGMEAELVQTERDLKEQVEGKEYLLRVTVGQEAKYQLLIQEMRAQEAQSLDDIQVLQEAIALLQNDLVGSRSDASGAVLSDDELRNRAMAIYQLGQQADTAGVMFAWPVEPKRGVSAYFRDPSYTRVFGVPHSAIDVPAPQGTPLLAPADAYVYKVADNGYGYSYVILAHRGDFLTLYGHVSRIMVSAGQTLKRGEVIGLSGGAPGTPGAGWMTTGPHLHFEVFKNGRHVDPLLYLDRSQLRTQYTPTTDSFAPSGSFLNPGSSSRSTGSARPLPTPTAATAPVTPERDPNMVLRVQE